jgi:hypothetical protein
MNFIYRLISLRRRLVLEKLLAITLVKDIPTNAKIVTKGAFFVNAKLSNKGEE